MQNMEPPLNVAVIGVGHLGRIHARLWKGIPGAELVGIYDVDAERSESMASELEIRSFVTLEDLFRAVDAVSIVTPTSTHAEIATQALSRGVHCFIEKPITATYDEAVKLIELAESDRLTLQVGHVERFNPAFLALGEEELHPMFIESHRLAQFKPRATDVAVVLDLMIHDIDLILHIVGAEVREVRASGVAVVSDSIDIANARIEFVNGCVANLTASRISQKQMRKMRLFQKDAYISIDFAGPSVEIFRIGAENASHHSVPPIHLGEIEAGTRRRSILYERPEVLPVNAIERELQEFVTSVRNGTPPPVTAIAGARALQLAEEIIREIEERKVA